MGRTIVIVNDGRDAGYPYPPFFKNFGLEVTHDPQRLFLNPSAIGLVVFTGGSDVHPELYNESSPKGICYADSARDAEEIKIFNYAAEHKVPMFGVCRGLQFINVMCGGKLIHDLTGHQGQHEISTSDRETFMVNSLHHQAVIPPMNAEVLAWSVEKRSEAYIGDKDEPFDYRGPEIESVHYPNFKAAGVQWHPEAMFDGGTQAPRGRTWAYLLARDLTKCTDDAIRKLYYIGRPKVKYVSTKFN